MVGDLHDLQPLWVVDFDLVLKAVESLLWRPTYSIPQLFVCRLIYAWQVHDWQQALAPYFDFFACFNCFVLISYRRLWNQ